MPSTTLIRTCYRDFPGPGTYNVGPLIGCKHDPTFWINPCYSFGRTLNDVLLPEGTPSPLAYNLDKPKVTKYGLVTVPSVIASGRRAYLSAYIGPGPLNYSPELYLNSVFPRAPKHSIHLLLPTKPILTPGPKYDPRFFFGRRRAPAFSIIPRRRSLRRLITPAPFHYGLPSLRLTKPTSLAFTLMPRRRFRSPSPVPSPADYDPNYPAIWARAPRFKLNSHMNQCIQPFILREDDEYNVFR